MSKHTGQQSNHPEGIKRTTLQKSNVPGTNYETVFGIAEIAPMPISQLHPSGHAKRLCDGRQPNAQCGRSADARSESRWFCPHTGRCAA
jgi:hypothetical protein